jgi:hypothetical protein
MAQYPETIIITETTALIVLTYSGGRIEHIQKRNLSVIFNDDNAEGHKIILSWPSGTNKSSYDSVRLGYGAISSPTVANDAALLALLIGYVDNPAGGSGAGSAGGGSIVYSNASKDFVATPAVGAKTITITELPFTLEDKNIAVGSVKVIDSNGDTKSIFSGQGNVTVSGGVITLGNADDFVSGDTVVVTLIGPDKAYAKLLDALKVIIQNNEWAHYTDIEHILDESDATVDQHYTPPIFMEGFRNITIQFTGSSGGSGVTFKIYGTVNPSAALPADGDAAPSLDWFDLTTAITGGATVVLDGGNSEVHKDNEYMVDRYLIQYEPDNATNESDIFIRKY